MLVLQSFLRKGVSFGYVGLNQNHKDRKEGRIKAERGVPSRVQGAGCEGAGCRVQGCAAICGLSRCVRAPGQDCCRAVNEQNVDNVNKVWRRWGTSGRSRSSQTLSTP